MRGRWLGAKFAQYTVEFGAGGGEMVEVAGVQRFCYVLEGEVELRADGYEAKELRMRWGYCYLPAGLGHTVAAEGVQRGWW